MASTPTRQRNAVSEGMALGLLMCGHNSLRFDKLRLDLAFVGAWRSWSFRDRFPQVNTDLAKGLDGARTLTRADARKQVSALYWQDERGKLQVCARQPNWTPDDPDDAVESIDGGVPLAGWEDIAREFLTRFERK